MNLVLHKSLDFDVVLVDFGHSEIIGELATKQL
jgi:hypothetical protein